jgi:hypothetical protein
MRLIILAVNKIGWLTKGNNNEKIPISKGYRGALWKSSGSVKFKKEIAVFLKLKKSGIGT